MSRETAARLERQLSDTRQSLARRINELEGKGRSPAEDRELARIRVESAGAPQFYDENENAIVEQLKRDKVFNMKAHRTLNPPKIVALLMVDKVEWLRQTHFRGRDRRWDRKYWLLHYITKRPQKFPRPQERLWQDLTAEYMDLFCAPRSMRIKAVRRLASEEKDNPYLIVNQAELSDVAFDALKNLVDGLNREAASTDYAETRVRRDFPEIPTDKLEELQPGARRAIVQDPNCVEYDGELPPLPPANLVSEQGGVAFYMHSALESSAKSKQSAYSSFRDKVLRQVAQIARVKCSSAKKITR